MRSRQSSVKRPDAMNLKQSIQTLWPYITKFKGRVLIAILALVGAKGATLLMPWALKEIIDAVDKSINPLLLVPTLLLVMYGALRFASVFLGEVRDAVFSRVTEHAMRDIGLKVFKHLHSLDLAFHLDRQTGGISRDIERGTSGLSFLMRFLMFNIVPTLFEIMTVAIIFGTLFSIWFALITLLAVAIYIFFTVAVTQWRNRFIRESNAADNQSNTRAIDSLLNYETVKYFNNEEYEAKTYDTFLATWEQARLKNRLSLLALNSGQALIIACAITALMWLGASEVVTGELTIGELVMINAYMIQLFLPLNFLGFVYREIRRALTDLENMLGLLNTQPKVADAHEAKELVIKQGEISFDKVSFHYDSKRPILKSISFNVAAGSKVAIVGASGAGKSSLARLLYRFYELSSGTISIDKQAINTVTLASLRKAIAIVPQDTVLFNSTIRENIAYGRPSATEDEINKAINMAHLTDFINSLDKGDKTLVGERGLKVSGGEKQRIAIARAILKQSPILIFDEATSALDSHAEQAILKAMREVANDHTSIVIAHRLSTITDADSIIVLKAGEIIEQGKHQELLNQNGEYARMWALQQKQSKAQ
ncbi:MULTISPECIES: ABC transporter ATP-binding protein/permease [Pseudoalteromonas]|jgi:ATP-binding cassette subfamily B protein|uniref:ABCB family ABC transporter ATP-binding protein/permease n=1 Tax=Pseudoalteromonas TaxID=53246 RepID=UPI000427FB34|nr:MULTISPECIES: ABC transporter ATP-binding protein/permease [Pseudoalteromonas]MDN3396469.1 ABC transporter ATP-binding protein/permease [Pseudoalteromonas sp. APC 3215]MDN3401430.1 ABC transporter ATP-binding protein/permease [Pseudoalteromonas sp. APC 3213]MDN3403921.1 ABC transporter ATP-binding protein/permease [Pseudoalteromonas sp. APC 3218]MDN3410102.1 ABC transporter ATP-binding protein/permease [Pseudoalteromonas sp. APC 3894]MDN3417295.1 ABC transporter ATP-binding protein/permease|tara:strand:+ start:19202 stop:20992 length:1791 start_codon:yes stop_codon:yes gene_type:complete